MEILIEELPFSLACRIEPELSPNGSIREFMPQARYRGVGISRLNPNGHGPFCKFKVPSQFPFAGVYAVTMSDRIMYIGECVNLSTRWGLSQYGSIQPKNCYVGGQSTNCKINNRILEACRAGSSIKLWFHRTDNYKSLEQVLRVKLRPEWNSQL
jgi:hypothetical protein